MILIWWFFRMNFGNKKSDLVLPIKVNKGQHVNYCYLVVQFENKDAILVAPAWEMDKIQTQIDFLQANLKFLLTHHRKGHVHLADGVARLYNVPVYMSEIEVQYYGFKCTSLFSFLSSNEVQSGSVNVYPIHNPGHTKDSVCYLINTALFTGDILFIEGCGLCVGPGENPSEMYDSPQNLRKILPPYSPIYPGHSYRRPPCLTFEFLRKYNLYLSFKKREDFIAFRMRRGQKGLLSFK